MLQHELETATALARRAGRSILEFYKNGFVAEEKIGVDNYSEPVTIADRMASRIIVDGLAKAFPGDGILSEEEPDDLSRLSKERVWIIDPMDGTAGFVKKDGDFGVQIGLAIGGVPVAGVVFLPYYDVLYYAAVGGGAYSVAGDGSAEKLAVSDETDFARMGLAASRNHRTPRLVRVVEELGLRSEVRRGSVGLKIGLIATRECDLYIHLSPRSKIWDTCAPQIILEEAGGRLTDLFGSPIRCDQPDVQNHNGVLATNGSAHFETVTRLRPILNEFGRARHQPSSDAL